MEWGNSSILGSKSAHANHLKHQKSTTFDVLICTSSTEQGSGGSFKDRQL